MVPEVPVEECQLPTADRFPMPRVFGFLGQQLKEDQAWMDALFSFSGWNSALRAGGMKKIIDVRPDCRHGA